MSGDVLHGRDRELDLVAGVLDAVARGERRLLVVRGEAGIGKTRLLAELQERAAAQRFVVLSGRATELERDIPLVPVAEAIDGSEIATAALGQLSPARRRLVAGALEGVGGEAAAGRQGSERWRLFGALGDLLAQIGSQRPLLVTLDDVHWADPATRELLDHLVRRPPAGQVLLAIGVRPGAEAEDLLAAQHASGEMELVAIELLPLGRDDADPLMAELAPGADRDRLYAMSGGNPLLLGELARGGGAGALPGGVVAAIRAEIDALPEPARDLLRAAAVAGDPFDLDLATSVAGLEGGLALDALDAAEQRELVRPGPQPGQFVFRHPVVRTAVYESLGSGARRRAHAAAARELARIGAPAAMRARHLAPAIEAGDAEGAAVLRQAAADVRPRSPAVAADWLLAARRSDPGATDVGVLAETLVEAGRLEEALDAIDAPGDAALDVRAAVAGAGVERLLGRHDSARRRLERALAGTREGGPEAASVLANLAAAAYQRGDYALMSGWAARIDPATPSSAVTLAVTWILLAVGDASRGETGEIASRVGAAVAALEGAGQAELGAGAELAIAASWGLLALDRLPEGLATAQRVGAAARATGYGVAALPHDLAAVLALGLLGRTAQADRASDEAEQAARVSGNPQLLQWALWMRGWVLLDRGLLDAATAAARESAELAAGLDDSASAVVARAVLGAVLAARGESARGRDLLAAYDIDRGWICRWAPVLVECDLALDDASAASEHAARAARLAPGTGMAGARAAAARAQALVASSAGEWARAAELALGGAEMAAQAGLELEEARGTLVAGRALLADDAPRGVAMLASAEAQATHCGAERVADEARFELRRAGVRVGRGGSRAAGATGLDSLSRREREVAELVAEGLTNREIGARLFLSEKTIETHLTRVFQKLGLRSRAQVAARVAASD